MYLADLDSDSVDSASERASFRTRIADELQLKDFSFTQGYVATEMVDEGLLNRAIDLLANETVFYFERFGMTIATCESLTGGLISSSICKVPGASAVLLGGLVTYSSKVKVSLAKVDASLVEKHGVINKETASQMAFGAKELLGASCAISATGVAGPSGQDGHLPGEVWVGIALGEDISVKQYQFTGERNFVRLQTVFWALYQLLDFIWNKK